MSCIEANVEPGLKRQNDTAVLADRKVSEVPVIFIEGESISLSEAKSKVCQFLVNQYPADLDESPVVVSEDVASIDVFADDLDGETDWQLADLTGSFDLRSRAIIRVDYGLLPEASTVVSNSIPSSIAYLFPLDIRGVEATSRVCNPKVRVSASYSTISSKNTSFGDLTSPRASKNLELAVASVESSSTELCLPFPEDAVGIMHEWIQSQGPQLHAVEPGCVAAKGDRAAAGCNIHSLTTSELALRN